MIWWILGVVAVLIVVALLRIRSRNQALRSTDWAWQAVFSTCLHDVPPSVADWRETLPWQASPDVFEKVESLTGPLGRFAAAVLMEQGIEVAKVTMPFRGMNGLALVMHRQGEVHGALVLIACTLQVATTSLAGSTDLLAMLICLRDEFWSKFAVTHDPGSSLSGEYQVDERKMFYFPDVRDQGYTICCASIDQSRASPETVETYNALVGEITDLANARVTD